MVEEIKIIMEMFGTATGAAKQFGLVWLGIELLKQIFAYTLGGAVIFLTARLLGQLVQVIQEESFAKTMRRMVVNPDDAWGKVTSTEKKMILNALRRGLGKTEQEKAKKEE